MTPYKDGEKQREAMRKIMRNHRKNIRYFLQAKDMAVESLDVLEIGDVKDFSIAYVVNNGHKSDKMILPTKQASKLGDMLGQKSKMQLMARTRFLAFAIPVSPSKDIGEKILEITGKVEELRSLVLEKPLRSDTKR